MRIKVLRDYNQGQVFLLPHSLDEFVPENPEARIINDVVDTIVYRCCLLSKFEGGGAPAYHPAMMFKVIIPACRQTGVVW